MSDYPTAVLLELLRSVDPREPDEVAYSELAGRITPRDENERLAAIGDEMTSRFADEEIQVRSFAAVTLAEVLARDRLIGRLSASTVLAWQDEFTRWYRSEPDLRGWDERLGWLHAVAHGADALGSFGLNAHLGTPNLVGLLALARDRLLAPAEALFANQEDDRLGYAIAVVLSRPELDAEGAVSRLEEIGRAFDSGQARASPSLGVQHHAHPAGGVPARRPGPCAPWQQPGRRGNCCCAPGRGTRGCRRRASPRVALPGLRPATGAATGSRSPAGTTLGRRGDNDAFTLAVI